MPWSIPLQQEAHTADDLHVLGNTSVAARCTLVYVVVYQSTMTTLPLLNCRGGEGKGGQTPVFRKKHPGFN